MPSATENVKLGVCNVIFDGVDLGFTKGGVEVQVETSTHEVTVDQMGDTPIGELVTGRQVSATVPLAETTLENLVAIMPGSQLVADGAKATATITFATAAPVNNDRVTIAGVDFTFKTAPTLPNDMAIPATIAAAATALAAKINESSVPYVATAAGAVVTVTGKQRGSDYNATIGKTVATPANVTTTNLTGGVTPTKAKVVVSTGVNINLLSVAKKLVLRPRGTNGAEDFTIFKAACPGALQFTYAHDAERVYSAAFKGYAQDNGELFAVGDIAAV